MSSISPAGQPTESNDSLKAGQMPPVSFADCEIYLITGTQIGETGTLNYGFMIDSGAPFGEFSKLSGNYGYLRRKDDRLYLSATNNGRFLYEGGIDATLGDESDVVTLLSSLFETTKGLVILADAKVLNDVRKAATTLGFKLGVHEFDGTLTTG